MPYKEGTKWRAVVTSGGVRVVQKLFDKKRDATEWERKTRQELKEEPLQTGLDLGTLCTNYLLYTQRLTTQTQKEKLAVCKLFLQHLGADRLVENIKVHEIQTYLDQQAHKRTGGASNKDRKNLRSMWEYGIKFFDLKENPVAKTDKWPEQNREPQYTPHYEDIVRLLMAANRTERVFLDCYLQTGARHREILRWTWGEDINFKARQVRLGTKKTKDGSTRYDWLPMTDELYESLMWWWNNRPVKATPYVFVNQIKHHATYGQPYRRRRKFMKTICKRAGIQPFGFHALRRFVASLLDDRNYSLKYIQRVLRHARVSTTDRYIKNIRSDMEGLDEGLKIELVKSKDDKLVKK
jgi:integrase